MGDNWALKSSNLRKLVRNLEWYFHEDLKKDADFEKITANLGNIARTGDRVALAGLVELVAAAAVTCELKSEFVGRIMGMTQENQIQMKDIIENSLHRLRPYHGDEEDGDDTEMIFGEAAPDENVEDPVLFEANYLKQNDADKEELEKALLDARRELAVAKSQLGEIRDDSDKGQAKLRALVEDLQDRLSRRQDELIASEEELRTATGAVDELKNKISDLEEQKAQLADELDVVSAKATQLHKAEATVMAYKKKLEGVGVMNQQMTDLEDQAAGYLRQIMDLEAEVKKTTTLQRQVDSLQVKLASLQKEKIENSDSIRNSGAEISELKHLLASAEKAKKMYESELKEIKEKQAVQVDVPVEGFDSQARVMSPADREKTIRLEVENKKLKEELENAKSEVAKVAAAAEAAAEPVTGDTSSLEVEIRNLREQLATREAENKKLGSDKDKLEAYTKRTLAKFQDKYLVALQECKAKLKEKQDKIEILESRSATEKTAQKREERLLSSTIYELGLSIMQNKLKER